ncbi:MAG TPA: ADP-ribosylglycohydrolase family protein [Acidimicrobiales bacterium]|nr:ADP-ribosylglycohydrolase family protein [Acidimicrobiales bacterium]
MITLMPTKNGSSHENRIRNAWAGRISGCMLGKPIEQLSMRKGAAELEAYLTDAQAFPLRDYVPYRPDLNDSIEHPNACKGIMVSAIPDDDINYTVISVMLLEEYGRNFTTADVGRIWLRYLPGAIVYTAEREAYVKLLERAGMRFAYGAEPNMDLEECSDNSYNDWIGAQIRADLYGWINPGEPKTAARMAQTDARLSHRAEGVYGAVVVAAAGALVATGVQHDKAFEEAATYIPSDSDCAAAVHLGLATAQDATPTKIQATYEGMSPVHTVNNLALVTWGLVRNPDDFGAAIGDTVSGGWDTDCNGATVGALWGLTGRKVPSPWIAQWNDVIETSLAGLSSFKLQDLTARTVALID